MKTTFSRTDESIFGRWWWGIDRWMIIAIISIVACGAILALAASPAVAKHHDLDTFFFARRHFMIIPISLIVMFLASLLDHRGVRQLALICFSIFILLLGFTLFHGAEIKGAVRWIKLGSLSVQPSEFENPVLPLFLRGCLQPGGLKKIFPDIWFL